LWGSKRAVKIICGVFTTPTKGKRLGKNKGPVYFSGPKFLGFFESFQPPKIVKARIQKVGPGAL